jgi:hypothetical protein
MHLNTLFQCAVKKGFFKLCGMTLCDNNALFTGTTSLKCGMPPKASRIATVQTRKEIVSTKKKIFLKQGKEIGVLWHRNTVL